jgi:2-polyprenyl-3-methyl-5-hydroxy-6-metoxy-1,4-benzoquinol methylase
MDEPGLSRDRHQHALRGLARINFWSGSARILWPALRDLARSSAPRSVRVLDVATGGGDIPLRLWKKARRAGVSLQLEGCDVSPVAVAHAQAAADALGADVRFFVHDVLAGVVPSGYDAITCSLFLHHLDDITACEFLRRMASAAGQVVLVNDLSRGLAGLILAHVATRVLTRSDVVHVDGPRSVEAAFTPGEARELAARAGLNGAVVARRWPFRWLLTWRRP